MLLLFESSTKALPTCTKREKKNKKKCGYYPRLHLLAVTLEPTVGTSTKSKQRKQKVQKLSSFFAIKENMIPKLLFNLAQTTFAKGPPLAHNSSSLWVNNIYRDSKPIGEWIYFKKESQKKFLYKNLDTKGSLIKYESSQNRNLRNIPTRSSHKRTDPSFREIHCWYFLSISKLHIHYQRFRNRKETLTVYFCERRIHDPVDASKVFHYFC